MGVLALLLGATVQAQAPAWTVDFVLHDGIQAELLRVASDGTSSRSVLYTEAQATTLQQVWMSDDGRYLVLVRTQDDPYMALPLRIVNTETGLFVDFQALPETQAYNFAGFEPNSSRFAFSYVGGEIENIAGGMMVVNAATGSAVAHTTMTAANDAVGGGNFGVWAFMDHWSQRGILFTPNCYACEGVFEGELSLWDPDERSFVANSGVYFSIFGKRLNATNEMLYLAQETAFPYDPAPGMFPEPNVLLYYPDGNISGESMGVAYLSEESQVVRPGMWIADGMAFLANPAETSYWEVLYRNGTRSRIERSDNHWPLVGTPDGFLAGRQSPDVIDVLHYDLSQSEPQVVAQVNPAYHLFVGRAPRLGEALSSPQPFATIAIPDSTVVPPTAMPSAPPPPGGTQCAGFMPSRLVIGEQARVTPGPSNRLRAQPTTDSAEIGQIPGGGVFTVLGGPVCDTANGIAWWQVNYQGTVGWTAEGRGNEYWTEPLP